MRAFFIMARPEGVEPPASAVGGQRSIQLSYGRRIVEFISLCQSGFCEPDTDYKVGIRALAHKLRL